MFICQFCGTQVPRGVPLHRIVTKTRPKTYTGRWVKARNTDENKDAHEWRRIAGHKAHKVRGKPKFIEIWVPGVQGSEIVEELRACPDCFVKRS
jgi:hypothetical protein